MIGISIVIPVKNTPVPILKECIDSLLKQEFKDFEIICVDDNSDNEDTIKLLTQYKQNEVRFSVIFSKISLGAGEARNLGMKHIHGEYTIFLDSDDIFDVSFLRLMYEQIIRTQANVCVCGYSLFCVVDGRKDIIGTVEINKNVDKSDDYYMFQVETSPCNKLCRTEYLKTNKISFQSLSSDNDVFYSILVMMCTDRITFLPRSDLFFYRNGNEFQISSKRNPNNLLFAINSSKEALRSKGIYSDNIEKILLVYLVVVGGRDLKRCGNTQIVKQYYNTVAEIIRSSTIRTDSLQAATIINFWENNEFESYWFNMFDDYFAQLVFFGDILLAELIDKKIFLWGAGKRARAFLEFLKIKKIALAGICDSNKNTEDLAKLYNTKSFLPEEVLSNNCLIVASNENVYNYLQKKVNRKYQIELLNLEKYSPL